MAGVDETQSGRATEGDHDCVHDPVQAGCRSGKRLVDGVAGCEIVRVVLAALPFDSDAFGVQTIESADSGAFPSA